jgi:hypothetical protein
VDHTLDLVRNEGEGETSKADDDDDRRRKCREFGASLRRC